MSSIVIGTLYGQMSFMCLLILGVICFRFLKADDKTYSNHQFLAVGMLYCWAHGYPIREKEREYHQCGD